MQTVPMVKEKKAAAMLRVSPRRLSEMETDSPWWITGFRTDEGYDVVSIALASFAYAQEQEDSGRDIRTLRAELLAAKADVLRAKLAKMVRKT